MLKSIFQSRFTASRSSAGFLISILTSLGACAHETPAARPSEKVFWGFSEARVPHPPGPTFWGFSEALVPHPPGPTFWGFSQRYAEPRTGPTYSLFSPVPREQRAKPREPRSPVAKQR